MQDILWKADSHTACWTTACFPYGPGSFINALTEARHWTLSWASQIQFAPSIPICLTSILMLSSHLRLGLPTGFFPSGPQPKACKQLSLPHACYMSHPPYPPWFNHPNNIRRRLQAMKVIITQFYPRSVFLPFRTKYPSHHSVLKNPQSMFLP
jgi:hypothetical protein